MHVWKGWAATSESAATFALTWEQWCAYQARKRTSEQQQHEGSLFSDRELARLSFTRWLYQTGRLDPAPRQPLSAKPYSWVDTTVRRKSA
jgi:hypothetical protein